MTIHCDNCKTEMVVEFQQGVCPNCGAVRQLDARPGRDHMVTIEQFLAKYRTVLGRIGVRV